MAADTFARSIRTRLRTVIEGNGYSVSGLAAAMGHSNNWIARKLYGSRPLMVDDVDAVCTFLEVPWIDVTSPTTTPSCTGS